uniref:Uncharacterized protein n=1 Tax=Meloidogyne javanica TaxID=6303 RepID=A0A915LJ87_MELJA
MSENIQNSNDDLSSNLCSNSTFEDSLNRIKLLEVEKDKTNLAFQLILAKLDLLTNSTKQNFSENNPTLDNQALIKQLQNYLQKEVEQQKEKIRGLELDKFKKEEEIKILKENLEENKNVYENKLAKLEEERVLALDEFLKIKEEFEKLKNEKEKISKEKIKLLIKERLEKSNLTLLYEEDYKKLTSTLDTCKDIISQLKQKISENKKNYEQEIKQAKDLTNEQAEHIKMLNERNVALNEDRNEADKNVNNYIFL